MAKKYKTEEGDYLVADEVDGKYRVYWYVAELDDLGAIIGQDVPKKRDGSEYCISYEIMKPLADGQDANGFYFATLKKARAAVAAANQAMADGKPLPEWAAKATAAGWTAPKKQKVKGDVLLIWEQVPEENDLYLLPASVAVEFADALKGANGRHIGGAGAEDNANLWKICVAVTEPQYVEASDPNKSIAGKFLQYKRTFGPGDAPIIADISAVYVCGIFM